MNIQNMQPLHKLCQEISNIKQKLIEELPHYGHHALFFNNDEITTGLLNNKIELKLHLFTGQLTHHNNEKNTFIDLYNDDLTQKLNQITEEYGFNGPHARLENLNFEKITAFKDYAIPAKRVLELFRMTLRDNFTLIHLWPHHFDFSVEWFTGNADEQIGTGISPGDAHHSEPYLYMNPYPFDEAIKDKQLPIGQWNSEGFNGVKIEWKDLLKYPPQNAALKIQEVFQIVKTTFVS